MWSNLRADRWKGPRSEGPVRAAELWFSMCGLRTSENHRFIKPTPGLLNQRLEVKSGDLCFTEVLGHTEVWEPLIQRMSIAYAAWGGAAINKEGQIANHWFSNGEMGWGLAEHTPSTLPWGPSQHQFIFLEHWFQGALVLALIPLLSLGMRQWDSSYPCAPSPLEGNSPGEVLVRPLAPRETTC